MTKWNALSDLFSRTVHKGQMSLDGEEAAEDVVRPAKVPEAHVRLVPAPAPEQEESLPFDDN